MCQSVLYAMEPLCECAKLYSTPCKPYVNESKLYSTSCKPYVNESEVYSTPCISNVYLPDDETSFDCQSPEREVVSMSVSLPTFFYFCLILSAATAFAIFIPDITQLNKFFATVLVCLFNFLVMQNIILLILDTP